MAILAADAAEQVPEQSAAPTPAGATLAVWLEDSQGRRVVAGSVLLWKNKEGWELARRARADSREPALFTGLEGGVYQIGIEPGSLGGGWVPVHPQGWPVSVAAPEPTRLELEADERRETTLLAQQAASLFGTVFAPDGRPAPYANLRINSVAPGLARGAKGDILADAHGNYSIELTPAKYLIHVMAGPLNWSPEHPAAGIPSASESPIYGIARPLPAHLTLAAGEARRHDFFFGRGRAVIRGRVVDERGAPVPGLRTFAYPSGEAIEGDGNPLPGGWGSAVRHVFTDSDGRFVLDQLEAARYGVLSGASGAYSPRERPGKNVLGDWPEPVYTRVAHGEEVDVGEIRVWRSRPFIVRGQVVSASGTSYAWQTVQLPGWRRRQKDMVYPLAIGWGDGSFSWHVETPEGAVLMRALDAQGNILHEETFHPEPDGQEWREIHMP